jgi:AhpD family alkylhydroperoxidase
MNYGESMKIVKHMAEIKMRTGFDKRIFTYETFVKDIGFILSNTPRAIVMSRNEKISRVFLEKIMAVVTAVNECVYCSWFHAKQAIEIGMSEQEVRNLFDLQFEADASEYELLALIYAQHYAETNRNPHPEMNEKLSIYYGDETAKQIILIIRIIFFGNLLGNTWDAILSRLKGNPARGSNVLFESIFFLLTWYFMIPGMFLAKNDRRTK